MMPVTGGPPSANEADRPARLAFVLPNMRGGGAERVALTLIEASVAAGHQVDLVLMQTSGELLPLVPSAVRVVNLAAPRIRNAFAPLRRYFAKEAPDAVQALMFPLTAVSVAAHRAARSRAWLMVADHTNLSRRFAELSKPDLALLRASIRLTYPLADARISVSRDAAADLAKLGCLRPDSIEVIYNPVNAPPVAQRSSPEIEAMWGPSRPRILSVGSFNAVKNHALLIRAFATLASARPARLMIVGTGELRENYLELAASLGVAESVVMPGFFTDPWPFYASADLFVLSSDYEGYPLVLIEALRTGLAVVSTDCPSGPREILEDGRYGDLVRCGDAEALAEAMVRTLDRPTDRQSLAARAEEISGRATVERYLELMTGRAP